MQRNVVLVRNMIHASGPEGEPPYLAITQWESGYKPIYLRAGIDLDALNKYHTRPQQCAYLHGSMFGWHTPAAREDAWTWEEASDILGLPRSGRIQ